MGDIKFEMSEIVAHKAELYKIVEDTINTHYAHLNGAPTDPAKKPEFIQHLATLACIPMLSGASRNLRRLQRRSSNAGWVNGSGG